MNIEECNKRDRGNDEGKGKARYAESEAGEISLDASTIPH
jgi:hypothetical protein